MTQYGRIQDGILVQRQPYDGEGFVEIPDGVVCGMLYSDGVFTSPTLELLTPASPLTARQLRIGLVTNGFGLDQVEAAIASIADPQERAVAQIEWEYASQFERDHPLIAQVATALGLSEARVDGMWSAASAL